MSGSSWATYVVGGKYTRDTKLRVLEYYFRNGGDRFGNKQETANRFNIDSKTVFRFLQLPEIVQLARRRARNRKCATASSASRSEVRSPASSAVTSSSSASSNATRADKQSRPSAPAADSLRRPTTTTCSNLDSASELDQLNLSAIDAESAQLSQSAIENFSNLAQLVRVFDVATDELRNILLYECQLIYECRVCSALFRNLAQIITHKRRYCLQRHVDTRQLSPTGAMAPPVSRINGPTRHEPPADKTSRNVAGGAVNLQPRVILEPVDGNSAAVFQTRARSPRVRPLESATGADNESIVRENGGDETMAERVAELRRWREAMADGSTVCLGADGKIVDPANVPVIGEEEVAASLNPLLAADRHVCRHCNTEFSSRKTLSHHVRSMHAGSRVYFPCGCCSGTFTSMFSLERHLQRVHKKKYAELRRLKEQARTRSFLRNIDEADPASAVSTSACATDTPAADEGAATAEMGADTGNTGSTEQHLGGSSVNTRSLTRSTANSSSKKTHFEWKCRVCDARFQQLASAVQHVDSAVCPANNSDNKSGARANVVRVCRFARVDLLADVLITEREHLVADGTSDQSPSYVASGTSSEDTARDSANCHVDGDVSSVASQTDQSAAAPVAATSIVTSTFQCGVCPIRCETRAAARQHLFDHSCAQLELECRRRVEADPGSNLDLAAIFDEYELGDTAGEDEEEEEEDNDKDESGGAIGEDKPDAKSFVVATRQPIKTEQSSVEESSGRSSSLAFTPNTDANSGRELLSIAGKGYPVKLAKISSVSLADFIMFDRDSSSEKGASDSHVCTLCEAVFSSRSLAIAHAQTVHGERTLRAYIERHGVQGRVAVLRQHMQTPTPPIGEREQDQEGGSTENGAVPSSPSSDSDTEMDPDIEAGAKLLVSCRLWTPSSKHQQQQHKSQSASPQAQLNGSDTQPADSGVSADADISDSNGLMLVGGEAFNKWEVLRRLPGVNGTLMCLICRLRLVDLVAGEHHLRLAHRGTEIGAFLNARRRPSGRVMAPMSQRAPAPALSSVSESAPRLAPNTVRPVPTNTRVLKISRSDLIQRMENGAQCLVCSAQFPDWYSAGGHMRQHVDAEIRDFIRHRGRELLPTLERRCAVSSVLPAQQQPPTVVPSCVTNTKHIASDTNTIRAEAAAGDSSDDVSSSDEVEDIGGKSGCHQRSIGGTGVGAESDKDDDRSAMLAKSDEGTTCLVCGRQFKRYSSACGHLKYHKPHEIRSWKQKNRSFSSATEHTKAVRPSGDVVVASAGDEKPSETQLATSAGRIYKHQRSGSMDSVTSRLNSAAADSLTTANKQRSFTDGASIVADGAISKAVNNTNGGDSGKGAGAAVQNVRTALKVATVPFTTHPVPVVPAVPATCVIPGIGVLRPLAPLQPVCRHAGVLQPPQQRTSPSAASLPSQQRTLAAARGDEAVVKPPPPRMLKLGRQEEPGSSISSLGSAAAAGGTCGEDVTSTVTAATDKVADSVSCSVSTSRASLSSPLQRHQSQVNAGRLKVATTGSLRQLGPSLAESTAASSLQQLSSTATADGSHGGTRFVVKPRPEFVSVSPVPPAPVSTQSSVRPPPLMRAPQLHSSGLPLSKPSFSTGGVEQASITLSPRQPLELSPTVPVVSRAQRLSFLPSSPQNDAVVQNTAAFSAAVGVVSTGVPAISVSQTPTVLKLSYVPAKAVAVTTVTSPLGVTSTRAGDHSPATSPQTNSSFVSPVASSRETDDSGSLPAKRIRSSFHPQSPVADDNSIPRRLPVLAHTYSRRSFSSPRASTPITAGTSTTTTASGSDMSPSGGDPALPKTRSRTEAELELNSRRTRRSSIVTSAVNRS